MRPQQRGGSFSAAHLGYSPNNKATQEVVFPLRAFHMNSISTDSNS
jgi:hypothetical protein